MELSAETKVNYEATLEFAQAMDQRDPLKQFRQHFLIPQGPSGQWAYFAGNSLGLQPKKVKEYIDQELEDWAKMGVEGHWAARKPWLPYHENLTEMSARLVGAKPHEVVVMNTLTVNLHLMMVTFYRPTKSKYKIMIEAGSFPSDHYAVDSQAKLHGFDPKDAVVELQPRQGEDTLRTEDILAQIEKDGDQVALILLGNVNYLTGQAFQVAQIAKAAHAKGAHIGLNLAHGAGNLLLQLHDWDVDFAVWCSYKYLNSGPGSLAGCFIHERHATNTQLPRFAGWWGHDKPSRFQMGPEFQAIPTAEGWQLSNPPIFQLAALRASMELFDEATMPALRAKSVVLTGYMEFMLKRFGSFVEIITPSQPDERGCQLSLRLKGDAKELLKKLNETGAICDFREPNIIRVAPTPMYNNFSDVYRFAEVLNRFVS